MMQLVIPRLLSAEWFDSNYQDCGRCDRPQFHKRQVSPHYEGEKESLIISLHLYLRLKKGRFPSTLPTTKKWL